MPTIAITLLPLILLFQQSPPPSPTFTAKMMAAHESIAPGTQTELLIEISISKPWHIYDPIILDTGFATDIKFDVPAGVVIGDVRFPAPHLGSGAGLEYLEHSGTIRCVAPLSLAEGAATGQSIEINADVSGLACVEMCLPVNTSASLRIPVTSQLGKPANEKVFAETVDRLVPLLSEADHIKGSTVSVSKPTLKIGEKAELIATVRVQDKHHIQDRKPLSEMAIPTRLFIEQVPGLKFVEEEDQIWPEPREHTAPGGEKERELAGEVKIRVPFEIADEKFLAGPVTLRVLLHYQCCIDKGQCYPPTWATAFVTFTADTPNKPVEEATPAATMSEPEPSGAAPEAAQDSSLASHIPSFEPQAWADGIPWQKWEAGLAEKLSASGYMVYVDYTATWCLTCQSNKATVLETDEIREKMRTMKVVPIKGDFTNQDPVMLEEIKKHGHNTVPLNLVYAANQPDTPGRLPALLTNSIVKGALDNPLEYVDGGEQRSLLFIIIASFLGGLILNVMPCVLPVISIKVLSFVQQAGEDRGRVFRLGLAFCGGIMVWFWAFAYLSSQGNVPWQHPEVVVALSSIIFLFSLNLFGVFEIVLPGAAAGKLDELSRKEGYTGAFLKGVLATLLGTACTAPFLATALGYALTQPGWVGFTIFTSAGIGMSLPYLLLSANPAWLSFLPRPGNWMIVFKQFTGFILLATAVWLLWILSEQLDGHGVVLTVGFWGFLGLAAWMYGRAKPTWQTSSTAMMLVSSVCVIALGFYFCYFVMYDWPA